MNQIHGRFPPNVKMRALGQKKGHFASRLTTGFTGLKRIIRDTRRGEPPAVGPAGNERGRQKYPNGAQGQFHMTHAVSS
jgi:hypothetical protein